MKKSGTSVYIKSLLGIAALSAIGCSKSSSDDPASTGVASLSISGALGTSTAASLNVPAEAILASGQNSSMAVTVSDLKVYAVAFTNPPTTDTANVGADGSFTLNLPGAKGVAVTAIFLDKTDDSQVGTLVFEDSSSKDLNGRTSQSSSVVLGDSVALGAITLSSDGKVKVPVATLGSALSSSSSVASGTAFDPTGTWYMKAFDGTLPTGYKTVTTSCGQGPCVGFPFTLIRMVGKKFTPVTNCSTTAHPSTCAAGDGTIGTDDRYALSIWGETFANGMGACGAKVGFTEDDARAYGRIHIPSLPTVAGNAISFGNYVFSTPTGFGGDASPFNLPWMKTGATASRDQQDCRPTTITGTSTTYNGWACKAKVMSGGWPGTPIAGPTYGWQVGVEGGGCFNEDTNKPVNVTNWSTIGMGNCTQSDSSATYGTGFKTSTCTYTAVDHDSNAATAAIKLSCSYTGGQFTDSSGPTTTQISLTSGQYLGQPTALVASGQLCSSIGSGTTAAKLAAYRCYAEAYWTALSSVTGLSCQREYNFNWAATTVADFAQDNERGKPKNAFITNILNYTPDGQMATLEDEEKGNITINTGANSSTFCETSRRTVMSFKKISDTRMLVDLKQSGQMNSTSAACMGAAKDALAGKSVGGGDLQHILTADKMIFYGDTSL